MSIGNQNEITVRVMCSNEKLNQILKETGFKEVHQYNSTDIFLVPNNLNIYKEDVRKILENAILLRESNGITVEKHRKRITFKSKNINKKGEILSQYSVNCDVDNLNDAKELFEHIGYKEIMKIEEKHTSFEKDGFKLVIKYISSNNILIEIETNDKYKNIEKLKEEINKTKIPFDHSNYFIKKAEEELKKIIEKGE